jgi:selenocysteine-specific elongation factor
VLTRALAQLADLHRAEPWTIGATSIALSRALGVDESLLVRVLAAFGEDGRIAIRSGYYATLDHQPTLSAEQRAFFDETIPLDPEHPFLPASFDDVVEAVKHAKITGLPKSFDTLLVRGVLVKIGEGLYRGTQIAKIHAKIAEYIEAHGRMTMAEFRDLLGTSRKYAVPLLEWFDSRAITVRSGDYRMLRTRRENGDTK